MYTFKQLRRQYYASVGVGLLAMSVGFFLPTPAPVEAQTIIKKQNPQSRVVYFLMVDSSSTTSAGKTGLTGQSAGTAVTLTAGAAGSFTSIQYSTNGGTLANCSGTIAEIGKGYYAYVPTSTESNTTFDCLFVAQGTGAIDFAGQVAFSTYKVDDLGPQTDKIGTTAGDSSNVTGIKSQTDKMLFDGSNFLKSNIWAVNTGVTFPLSGNGDSALTRLFNMSNSSNQFVANAFALLPNVTVGGYASGQDPATLILAATIDGSLTFKQVQAITMAYLAGRYTTVRDTNAKTLTTTYKRADNTTTLAVSVTSYADTGLTQPTGRTWTYSNLP